MNVYIKVTERCNLCCRHCYNPPRPQDISYPKIKKFLISLKELIRPSFFILHGGEPLMGDIKQIQDLINTFSEEPWRISTNLCYELTPERLEILKHMKQIRVSFDVGIRFHTLRNLLRWYHNVKTIEQLYPGALFLNVCLTKQLLQHDPIQLLQIMHKLNIKQLGLERITLKGNAKNNQEIIPSYKEIDTWLCKLYHALKQFPEIKCMDIDGIRLGILKEFKHCYGKECCCQTMTINADGTIGNCPNDAHDHIIGSLDSDIRDILAAIWTKKHPIKNQCLMCSYWEQCRGFCNQMDWQGKVCPYPKLLAEEIYKNEFGSKLPM